MSARKKTPEKVEKAVKKQVQRFKGYNRTTRRLLRLLRAIGIDLTVEDGAASVSITIDIDGDGEPDVKVTL